MVQKMWANYSGLVNGVVENDLFNLVHLLKVILLQDLLVMNRFHFYLDPRIVLFQLVDQSLFLQWIEFR